MNALWLHSRGRLSHIRVNVSIRLESSDGSLPFTTPKGCINYTTRHRVRDSARSPPSHIRHIRNPTFCPRSYAYYQRTRSPHSHSLYTVKVGYPPRALTAVIPELPLSSLGLAPGDQLIVVQKSGSAAAAAPSTLSSSPVNPAYPGHTPAAGRPTHTPSSNSNPNPRQVGGAPTLSTIIKDDGRPDYVTMDGGYLIHRVRVPSLIALHCVRGHVVLI